jgi:hypothetical protein
MPAGCDPWHCTLFESVEQFLGRMHDAVAKRAAPLRNEDPSS